MQAYGGFKIQPHTSLILTLDAPSHQEKNGERDSEPNQNLSYNTSIML
jgi:hypothetical protein